MTTKSPITLFLCIASLASSQSNHSCASSASSNCQVNCFNKDCIDTIIDCDRLGSNKQCFIYCFGSSRRRFLQSNRNILSIFDCTGDTGCCGSTIYCPKDQYCSVDCTDGCNHVTIHAEDAKWLYVKNCNQESGNNYCGSMNIHCPRDGRGDNTGSIYSVTKICTIQGDSTSHAIQSSNIYTEEGFMDLDVHTIDVVCSIYLILFGILPAHLRI